MSDVLIVDDDPTVARGIRRFLKRTLKLSSDIAANTRDAKACVAATQGKGIRLALIDYELENGELGTDLLAWFRETYPMIPTLLMSGTLSESAIRRVDGQFKFLRKPIDQVTLRKAIEEAPPCPK